MSKNQAVQLVCESGADDIGAVVSYMYRVGEDDERFKLPLIQPRHVVDFWRVEMEMQGGDPPHAMRALLMH